MKRETISMALNDLDDRYISEALALTPRLMDEAPERKAIMRSKRFLVLAIAAVLVIALGTAAYAAFASGSISSIAGYVSPFTETRSYQKTCKNAQELGVGLPIPESFSNGYAFKSSNIGESRALDSAGDVLAQGKELTVSYEKAGCPNIKLCFLPPFAEDSTGPATESRAIHGIEVQFTRNTMKFVPEDYVLTEEDELYLNDPHFQISYGADELSYKEYAGISFEYLGTACNLFSLDNRLTQDEWFGMAEELLG